MAYFQPSFRTKFYSNSMKGLIGFEVSQMPSNHTICNLKVCWQFHLRQPQKELFAFQELYILLVVKNAIKREFNFR